MDPIKTEIVVVGAGPGGYAAAFYAADLGKKVIMIERDKRLGGVCLNRGCIPSKALLYAAHTISSARESEHRGITFGSPTIDVAKLRAWKESIVTKLSGGVAYFPRHARDVVTDFQEIAGNIRRGYSIGYQPSSAQHHHDQRHRVKVVVRVPGRSDLSVRVRNEYSELVTPGSR